jgi:hypothetical protein
VWTNKAALVHLVSQCRLLRCLTLNMHVHVDTLLHVVSAAAKNHSTGEC